MVDTVEHVRNATLNADGRSSVPDERIGASVSSPIPGQRAERFRRPVRADRPASVPQRVALKKPHPLGERPAIGQAGRRLQRIAAVGESGPAIAPTLSRVGRIASLPFCDVLFAGNR